MQAVGVATWRANFEEELGALLHDLLDLQEASYVDEQELVPHVHAQPACIAKCEDLLE